METFLIILQENDIVYVGIDDPDSFIRIHNMFCHGIIFEPKDGIEHGYVGIYNEIFLKDNEAAEKNYLMAIEQNNKAALNYLGVFYQYVKNDHENAKKYYLEAIEHGNVNSVNNIARLFSSNGNYDEAIKYHLIAIKHGNFKSMIDLGFYYEDRENFKKAKEYYLMAIDNSGNLVPLQRLMNHYKYIPDASKLIKICVKYQKLLPRKEIIDYIEYTWRRVLDVRQKTRSMKSLLSFRFLPEDEISISLRLFSFLLHHHINIMKAHFEFTIDGSEYLACKKNFEALKNN